MKSQTYPKLAYLSLYGFWASHVIKNTSLNLKKFDPNLYFVIPN